MADPIVPREGIIAVNPHQVEGGYNGVECDPDDPRMTLRHFFGVDIVAAISAAGRLNGRSRDFRIAREFVDKAIAIFGPVREVYFPNNSLEVTASFGSEVYNRLWIAGGYINSRGKLDDRQYLHAGYEGIWTLDFVDRPGARVGQPRPTPVKPDLCTNCFLSMHSGVGACPNCGMSAQT